MLAPRLLLAQCGVRAAFAHSAKLTVNQASLVRAGVPIRAYSQQYAARPAVSQNLWRMAGAGAVVGLGVVALDGLKESAGPGTYQGFVSQRIAKTYGYVVGGIGITAAFATAIARTPSLYYRIASVNPIAMMVGTVAGVIGSQVVVQSTDNTLVQHAAWVGLNGFIGLTFFPVAMLGGALVQRAVIGTAAIVGSISLAAATTRSDNHLAMAGPLSVGFGVVLAASIGQVFLPASPLLYNVVMYGGLAVFGGFTYFDTQRMIQKAKFQQPYNPLRQSIHIYMDTINIFWRMLALLQGGGRRK